MYISCLATDYDGTLAHDGIVDGATADALVVLRRSDRKLLLVTGRELPDLIRVVPGIDLFDLVVAENRMLLFDPSHKKGNPARSRTPPRNWWKPCARKASLRFPSADLLSRPGSQTKTGSRRYPGTRS
jgi:hydroxymethylpyrimidine pyrophosphatase-like HAD family hydrolase